MPFGSCGLRLRDRGCCSFLLGSARGSRAGDGALAIANFFVVTHCNIPRRRRIDCGEAPQSAREARALPRTLGPLGRLIVFVGIVMLVSCESTNYVPPVTATMASGNSRRQDVDLDKLRQGRALFVHRCIECHTLPVLWHYTPKDWTEIVNNMSHRASLKTAERDAVIAYILAVRATER